MAKTISARYDLAGEIFGRLTVKEPAKPGEHKKRRWLCVCSCGAEKVVGAAQLKSDRTKSCGCLNSEAIVARFTKHKDIYSPEYKAWAGMWGRTSNPKDQHYELYKGRTPSQEFRDYEVFLAHIGRRPSPEHSLDRINNNLGYIIGNLRWATKAQQSRNQKTNVWYVEIATGNYYTQNETNERLGLSYGRIVDRLQKGWTPERATNGLYRKATPEEISGRNQNPV